MRVVLKDQKNIIMSKKATKSDAQSKNDMY